MTSGTNDQTFPIYICLKSSDQARLQVCHYLKRTGWRIERSLNASFSEWSVLETAVAKGTIYESTPKMFYSFREALRLIVIINRLVKYPRPGL